MENNKLIGLSLSMCVRNIILKKVKLCQVEKIICGTKINSPEDMVEVLTLYSKSYWRENVLEAIDIVDTLFHNGMIHQPKLEGKDAPNLSGGHWIDDFGNRITF